RQHGAERDEARPRRLGHDSRQRRLARAGRAPENDRLEEIALDRLAKRLPRREELFLADEFVECTRPYPFSERCGRWSRRWRVGEEGIHVVLHPLAARLVNEKRRGHCRV